MVQLSPVRPDHLPYLDIPLIALPRPPRSPDRTRSPVAVSRKREYFKYPPETIGDFALRLSELGAWRRRANLQKAAIGGHLCDLREYNLQLKDCLAGAGTTLLSAKKAFIQIFNGM